MAPMAPKIIGLVVLFSVFVILNSNLTFAEDVCLPEITNTSWTEWGDLTCVRGDYFRQSRSSIEYDLHSCGDIEPYVWRQYRTFGRCDYCTPEMSFTEWSEWGNSVCYMNNTLLMIRERLEYDFYACGEIDPIKHLEYQYDTCDYCWPDYQNTSWSDWDDYVCQPNNTMKQMRYLVEYDDKFCGWYSDTNHSEYRLFGDCDYCMPEYQNTTWSDWENESCIPGNVMNQTRRLTQYDTNFCPESYDDVFYEHRSFGDCDYCVPNLVNVSVGIWQNVTCLMNTSIWQQRLIIQFDNNSCGDAQIQDFYEYQINDTCPICNQNSEEDNTNVDDDFICLLNTSQGFELNIDNFTLDILFEEELYLENPLSVKTYLQYTFDMAVEVVIDYSLKHPNKTVEQIYSDHFKLLNLEAIDFALNIQNYSEGKYELIAEGLVEGTPFLFEEKFTLSHLPTDELIKRSFYVRFRILIDLFVILLLLSGILIIYYYQFRKYGGPF